MPAAPPDHTPAVEDLLKSLGWVLLRYLGPEHKPVYRKVLSAKYPHPCLKCVVGRTWVTYYRLVGESVYDMDSLRASEVGTLERVLSEMAGKFVTKK